MINFCNLSNDIKKTIEEVKTKRADNIEKVDEIKKTISNLNEHIINTTNKLDEHKKELEEHKKEFNDLLNNYATIDNLNDVIKEVKDSFELYINMTPREPNELKNIIERINILEDKINTMPQIIEIAPEKKSKSIPKLDLIKKK